MLRNFPIFCGISSFFFFFAFRNYFTAEANVVATFNMWVVLPCLWTCQNSRALFFNIHEIQSSYLFICIFFFFFIFYSLRRNISAFLCTEWIDYVGTYDVLRKKDWGLYQLVWIDIQSTRKTRNSCNLQMMSHCLDLPLFFFFFLLHFQFYSALYSFLLSRMMDTSLLQTNPFFYFNSEWPIKMK